MCNIVLSDDLSIRSYFEKVLNLSKLGDKFPVNLDDVYYWFIRLRRKLLEL